MTLVLSVHCKSFVLIDVIGLRDRRLRHRLWSGESFWYGIDEDGDLLNPWRMRGWYLDLDSPLSISEQKLHFRTLLRMHADSCLYSPNHHPAPPLTRVKTKKELVGRVKMSWKGRDNDRSDRRRISYGDQIFIDYSWDDANLIGEPINFVVDNLEADVVDLTNDDDDV